MIAVFWDVAPCSLVDIHRRFGGAYSLHLKLPSVSTKLRDAASQKTASLILPLVRISDLAKKEPVSKHRFSFV
jgi:hypothetical protein